MSSLLFFSSFFLFFQKSRIGALQYVGVRTLPFRVRQNSHGPDRSVLHQASDSPVPSFFLYSCRRSHGVQSLQTIISNLLVRGIDRYLGIGCEAGLVELVVVVLVMTINSIPRRTRRIQRTLRILLQPRSNSTMPPSRL